MVERFQSGDGPSLFLLSLRAGGTGITLTAAQHVVHLDRWWNPAVEDQATDRAFRIGQKRTVGVRKLVCAGTMEERIHDLIAGKRALADLAVRDGEDWLGDLSTDELAKVLSLDAEPDEPDPGEDDDDGA
jgi:SNF2 family DNA or RNA helicase